jgi:hypothetical protein
LRGSTGGKENSYEKINVSGERLLAQAGSNFAEIPANTAFIVYYAVSKTNLNSSRFYPVLPVFTTYGLGMITNK